MESDPDYPHWQDASVMEIIAPRLEGLGYGEPIDLRFLDGSLFIGAGNDGDEQQ